MAMDFKLRRRRTAIGLGGANVVDGCRTGLADALFAECFALVDLFNFAKKSVVINWELLNNGMYVPWSKLFRRAMFFLSLSIDRATYRRFEWEHIADRMDSRTFQRPFSIRRTTNAPVHRCWSNTDRSEPMAKRRSAIECNPRYECPNRKDSVRSEEKLTMLTRQFPLTRSIESLP